MKKRRHHYVWRYYLNSWATNEMIWCFRDGKIFNTNLMNVGQERDFYTVEKLSTEELEFLTKLIVEPYGEGDAQLNEGWLKTFQMAHYVKDFADKLGVNDGKISEQITSAIHNIEEDYHSYIESSSAKYLNSLLSGDISFYHDSDECLPFLYYISLQYMRTKKIQENVVRCVASSLPVSIKNLWPILRHVYATQIAKSFYIRREDYSPVLLVNNTGLPLLTGDQPIINTHAAKVRMEKEIKEVEFYYPLSKTVAVLITNNKKYINSKTYIMDFDEISFFNKAMVTCSHEQVFSSCSHSLEYFCEKKT